MIKKIYHASIAFIRTKIFRQDGIKFQCQQCGQCCTRPGTVYFSDIEINAGAKFLKISREEFLKKYINGEKRGYHVSDSNKSCPLFKNGVGCTIYPTRPIQCSTFPFWETNFITLTAERNLHKECLGMGKGKFYPYNSVFQKTANNSEDLPF